MSELEWSPNPDAVDALIEALNAETQGELTFERDALDIDRPEDWGAVEIVGAPYMDWADGHLIEQYYEIDLWICVHDRAAWWRNRIQGVLARFAQDHELTYGLAERGYLHNLGKVMWRWKLGLSDLADEPETDTDEDEEPDDTDDTDPGDTGETGEPGEEADPEADPWEDPEEDPEEDPDEDDWPEGDPETNPDTYPDEEPEGDPETEEIHG